MASQPSLTTDRLFLRPFAASDAPIVQKLAGKWEIADTTLLIPHPYPDHMAGQWISTHSNEWERKLSAIYAIVIRDGLADTRGTVCGAIGLSLAPEHFRGELGYWVGVPYWGKGYCTEAASEMLRFGFDQLHLNRIYAYHFVRNPASGRVLQKIGMQHEGRLVQHVKRWNRLEDLDCYGIVRRDWESQNAGLKPIGSGAPR